MIEEQFENVNSNPEEQETEGTRKMRQADERLELLEHRVITQHGGHDSKEEVQKNIDISLRDLVKNTAESWGNGHLDTERAGEMLLMAIEKIDEYKDDDDPSINGEKIAGALADLPNELLQGPLKDFFEAEGNDEIMDILAEIQRNDRNNSGLAI